MLKGIVCGNLGADAEIRQFKNGQRFVSFSVAHDRGRDKPTVWVSVSWTEGVGHPVVQYLKKGAKVHVTGDLNVTSYLASNGEGSAGIDIYADSVDVIMYPRREDAPQAPERRGPDYGPGQGF